MKHHYCTPSFWQGVRRISALLVCMFFTFVFVISPIKVKAEAFPIPPVWLPMNPYNAQGLEGNYVLLNDEQKEIVKEIIGAVNVVNLGFGQYVLMNPISGVQNTRQFLRDYGGTFLETFWSQIMGTSRAMSDFVGSTIYKASTYDTLEEYEADTAPFVASGSQKYFQISPELTIAFKNWYRANGGVEDWQYKTKPFTTNIEYVVSNTVSGVLKSEYDSYLAQLSYPLVKANHDRNYYFTDAVLSSDVFLTYNCIFIDTDNQFVVLSDSNGNFVTSSDQNAFIINFVAYNAQRGSPPYSVGHNYRMANKSAFYATYNASSYNTYTDLVNAIYNGSVFNSIDLFGYYWFEDFVQHVYVGADWSSKQEIYNIEDLNIGSTPSEYIDNIPDIGYVDINKLIGQIADEVVNLREVVEESVLVKDNTEAIPYADSLLVAIDKYINQPESGVVIPSNIFGGLTGANGPVSYLWYMTKPLVSYTGDLLGLLTLDGDGTFQFTGLGYIVIGVVTIGIIGGLVTKCLL